MNIKAIIFDFDEVLVKSYEDHATTFLETAKKFGLKLNKKDIYKRFGKSAKDILKEVLPELTKDEIEKFILEKERKYRKIISRKSIQPIKGAKELLEFLEKKKIKYGISSSASIKNIQIALRKTGLKKYFKTIVAAEHVKHHKPHPESLLKAAVLLRVRSENCVYVGDSIFEIQAARRAGMVGMGILTGVYNSRELISAGASKTFPNIIYMKAYLQSLLK